MLCSAGPSSLCLVLTQSWPRRPGLWTITNGSCGNWQLTRPACQTSQEGTQITLDKQIKCSHTLSHVPYMRASDSLNGSKSSSSVWFDMHFEVNHSNIQGFSSAHWECVCVRANWKTFASFFFKLGKKLVAFSKFHKEELNFRYQK